jgi:hypothetical protein
VGIQVGTLVGVLDGTSVGCDVGIQVGILEGVLDGTSVG